ncbi:alpha/beta fold hydrolase [Leptospira idonii]|uniref:Alpha/beta hydrolase n=1 Tax=Leptospira idonii TaxID=1193500 RepID=A0A4V3JY18_9LEPT|nr:alpha/beta hydrolase [Leptospira idonii]TGN19056.1 alpha/beta hydrolase [Leptospira idonii]
MIDTSFSAKTATEWLASGKFFDHNKQQIFYIQEGRGNNLLLLHGFPTSSWDYSRIFSGLSRHFNTFAVDFLGFGYSSKPLKHEYTLMEQTDIIESFIEKNALKRVKFVFHDYAVSVGQELLARNLENKKYEIDGAVFLNGGLFPALHKPTFIQKLISKPFLGAILAKLFNEKKFGKALSAVFGPDTKPSEKEIATLWKLATYPSEIKIPHKLLKYIAERKKHGNRWKNALLQTEVPLLFINGESDPVSGKHLIEEVERLPIKNKKIVRWERIGHYPQWEAPKESFLEIYDFLKTKD